jgi:phosphoglycolate phosphatase-like HAD superfamily hydrolase
LTAIAVDLDGVLGNTWPLWEAWLEDAARRFRPIAELDPAALPRDRGDAAALLDKWADAGVGDWRSALARFAEDRAPVFLRPDPTVNAALRAHSAEGTRIAVFTDAPEPLARIALAHLGASRHVEMLETGAEARERLIARLGPDTRVVETRAELYVPSV